MALLVEIRKEDRVVNGKLVEVGNVCYLPNSLALHLERTGYVAWPQEKDAFKAGKEKSLKRAEAKAKAEAAEKKKGKRN
jgi:hypothetical protein